MEILFIGLACSGDILKKTDKKYNLGKSSVRPQQSFDYKLVEGLSENNANVLAITEPPVASYPNTKCFFFSEKKETISKNLQIKYINLVNIFIIKTLIISLTIFFSTLKFCIKNRNKKFAIIFGNISPYTFFPVFIISKFFKVKKICIVPDIPQYLMNYSENISELRKKINNAYEYLNKIIQSSFDGYIFLTKYMEDLINSKKCPYLVMEGFISLKEISKEKKIEKNTSKKIIMYAGTLHKKFGIGKLVESFNELKNSEYEFWIFGEGDYEEKVKIEAEKNEKIKYFGVKSKQDIIELEKQVDLLVNPRPSNEEFTKYSFPSKTLEYMSSGTPFLTTKLKGIPEEYYEYLFFFENESIKGMAEKIDEVLKIDSKKLEEFSSKAQEFVKNKKNNIIQTQKILEFIQNIIVK